MAYGKFVEEFVRGLYANEHPHLHVDGWTINFKLRRGGITAKQHADGRWFLHKDGTCYGGTPDAFIYNDELFYGLEIKTASSRSGWGAPGSDNIPPYYLTQCAWYMFLFDCARWDVAVLIGNNDYREYTINRNAELEKSIVAQVDAFIENHLIPGVPPPVDGSGACRDLLNAERRPSAEYIQADEQMNRYAHWTLERQAVIAVYNADIDRWDNRLRQLCGHHKKIVGANWTYTLTDVKGSEKRKGFTKSKLEVNE